jgi:hypothetical protein
VSGSHDRIARFYDVDMAIGVDSSAATAANAVA